MDCWNRKDEDRSVIMTNSVKLARVSSVHPTSRRQGAARACTQLHRGKLIAFGFLSSFSDLRDNFLVYCAL